MVGALSPIVIVLGGVMAVVLIFSSSWKRISGSARSFGSFYARDLDIADLDLKSEDLGFVVLSVAAFVWIAAVMIARPAPLVGILYLVGVLGLSAYVVKVYLRGRIKRRIRAFREQFEGVLRSLAGGVRVGLGLRQALIHVAERAKNPASKELFRAVGASNLGMSLFDALDELARRLPTPESQMFVRIVRIQATSGGDLGGVLEGLADTIRDRRRLDRRVSALTMQARASAWVIGILPLLVLAFMMGTQPDLRYAILHTGIGAILVIFGLALDLLAVIILVQMTRFDS